MLGPELASTSGDATTAYHDISILNPDSVTEDVDEAVHLDSTRDSEPKALPGTHGPSPAPADNDECALVDAFSVKSASSDKSPPSDKVNADDEQDKNIASNFPEAGECHSERHTRQVLSPPAAEAVATSRQEASSVRGLTGKAETQRVFPIIDSHITTCTGACIYPTVD